MNPASSFNGDKTGIKILDFFLSIKNVVSQIYMIVLRTVYLYEFA